MLLRIRTVLLSHTIRFSRNNICKGEIKMKNYETPILDIKELTVLDEVSYTVTEDSDNETSWLENWTSAILGN